MSILLEIGTCLLTRFGRVFLRNVRQKQIERNDSNKVEQNVLYFYQNGSFYRGSKHCLFSGNAKRSIGQLENVWFPIFKKGNRFQTLQDAEYMHTHTHTHTHIQRPWETIYNWKTAQCRSGIESRNKVDTSLSDTYTCSLSRTHTHTQSHTQSHTLSVLRCHV